MQPGTTLVWYLQTSGFRLLLHAEVYRCKKKVRFYIAQYPVCWTAQSALQFAPSPGRPVYSDTNAASPGSILATLQLPRRLFTHIFTIDYNSQVLINTAEGIGASAIEVLGGVPTGVVETGFNIYKRLRTTAEHADIQSIQCQLQCILGMHSLLDMFTNIAHNKLLTRANLGYISYMYSFLFL